MNPITRQEMFLAAASGEGGELPKPITREEMYLKAIAENGGGGGGTGTTNYNALSNKPQIGGIELKGNKSLTDLGINIPTKTSQLTNDSNFVGDANYVHTDNNYDATDKAIVGGVTTALGNKVDKVEGKGLSTNDYSDADKAIVSGVTSALSGKVDTSSVGASNGVAQLDENGKVVSSQLPASIDAIQNGYLYQGKFYLEATHETEITPASNILYIDLVSENTYRWSGSIYVQVSESLALGETSSTAYAGDKGKANADAITAIKDGTSIDSFADVENALADKVNKETGKGLSTNDYSDADKAIVGGVTSALSGKVNTSSVGVASGVAGLDSNGKVPTSQLPELLGLGETSTTAYAGNKGKANEDAITAIKDGTNIDSFADVETALGNKADKVSGATNGNFAGLDANGNLTDSGKKASDFATPTDIQNVYKANGVLGAKNLIYVEDFTLIKSSARTKSLTTEDFGNDIPKTQVTLSFEVSDSNLTVNGEFRAYAPLVSGVRELLGGVPYMADGTYSFSFDATKLDQLYIFINNEDETTATCKIGNVMIRFATDSDATYQPYAKTNQELTAENEALTNQANDIVNVLGAKNLIPYPYSRPSGYTHEGMTGTYDEDGVITVNKTAGSVTAYFALYNNTLSPNVPIFLEPNKNYILSLEVENATDVSVYINDGNADIAFIRHVSTGKYEYSFTTPAVLSSLAMGLYWIANATETNAIVKPMIRLASITDDTYVPYAKTNRELTDFADIANNLVSNGGLRDITDDTLISTLTNGVYRFSSSRSSGLWNGYGLVVLVFKITNSTGIQIAFKMSSSADMSTQHIAVRKSYLDTWSNWTYISGTNQT